MRLSEGVVMDTEMLQVKQDGSLSNGLYGATIPRRMEVDLFSKPQ